MAKGSEFVAGYQFPVTGNQQPATSIKQKMPGITQHFHYCPNTNV